MLKASKKIILICVGVLLVIFISVFLLYKPVILQEGNPTPLVKGIMRLNFTKDKIVKLDISGDKYLTKSKDGQEILIDKLKKNNYRFIENLGSGYFFINDNLDTLIVTKKQYSRFYSIWDISEPRNIRESIEWTEYENKEYGFSFIYPVVSVNNKWWGNLSEEKPLFNLLLPNQVLSKNNNFYLTQKYDVEVDKQNGELIKTENTFIPEYKENDNSYPLPWHIVILDVESEKGLDNIIKQKLGSGCSYKTKIPTEFSGNYKIEIDGDGKDLGSTLCPVNYTNYIIYSPLQKKLAFWSTGQECQIGLGFFYDNCFDQKISDSFHFIDENEKKLGERVLFVVSGELACLPLLDENKPHNDLCVLGIKSNDDYYRLQAPSDDKNNIVNKIKKGQKIEISGELINEKNDTYKTLGTIKVVSVKYLYMDEKDIESNLPDSFKADYISFSNYVSNVFKTEEYPELESWPENGEIKCLETPSESSLPLRMRKMEINGQKYCVGASSEGAAGSVYTQYSYTTVIEGNVYLINFVARYPNCDNYPEKENTECQTERERFNLDILVDREIEKMRLSGLNI
jgi:hypothetical protein